MSYLLFIYEKNYLYYTKNCLTLKKSFLSLKKANYFSQSNNNKINKSALSFQNIDLYDIYETLTPLKQVVISNKGNLEVFVHRKLVVTAGLNTVFLCNGEKVYV